MNSNAPESRYYLDQLPDEALLAGTRSLVGRSNQVLAALLAHLAEVEARGIHRVRACASLYTYCIYELRMSEDAAFRRARAAKIAREFPIVFEQLAAGEIHLTGLLMLGPHLTEFNHVEVLARAKHRSKKEIARLVRMLDPLPDVPSRVEPLGPASPGLVPRQNPTWDDVVASSCPVRELTPGERPKDWIESDSDGASDASDASDADVAGDSSVGGAPALLPSPLAPERYKIQFLRFARDLGSSQPSWLVSLGAPQAKSTWSCSRKRRLCWRTRCRAVRSRRCTCARCARSWRS
jgi:hypothetical protein